MSSPVERLACDVHVHGGEDGSVVFPTGTSRADLPGWAKEAISNPDVWTSSRSDEGRGSGPEPEPESGTPSSRGVPPRAGAGSNRDAWAAYADAQGVQVADEANRAEIIEALDAANIPTD